MNGQPGPESTPQGRGRRHDADVEAVLDPLCEMYPRAFSTYEGRRRPLKVGIHHELLVALDGAVTEAELKVALNRYTANRVYRSRLRTGAVRYDLEGNPCGVVTVEHAVGDTRGVAHKALERVKATER